MSTWPRVKLGGCCDIISGSTPRRDVPRYWNGEVPWATPRDISTLDGRVLMNTAEHITEEGYRSCSTDRLPAGSILFSSRAPIGLVAIAGVPLCTNQGFKSLIPGPNISTGYLYWVMRELGHMLAARGSGSTFAEVSREVVSRFEIPLPPLAEQRRIARLLDTVDDVQAQRNKSLSLLEQLVRSAFLALFGDPFANERAWPMVRLADLVSDVQYGSSTKANSDGRGLLVLRMNNLTTSGEIDLRDMKWCEVAERDFPKYSVRPGDLLFNRTNSPKLVGKAAVWQAEGTFAFAGYLVRVRFVESRVSPHFVSACLNSASGKRLLFSKAKPSNNMSNISASELMRISIPVPPLELQQQYDRIRIAGTRLTQQARLAASQTRNLMAALVQREIQNRANGGAKEDDFAG